MLFFMDYISQAHLKSIENVMTNLNQFLKTPVPAMINFFYLYNLQYIIIYFIKNILFPQ